MEIKDYGADPIEDGMFRMVPSGDIVTYEERCKRLPDKQHSKNDCLGMSWEELAQKQGGLNTLDITRRKK
jgi:hypothetical protein